MSRDNEKFNPAMLSPDVMKGFQHDEKPTKMPKHFLYPGQIYVSHEPAIITTILGSCAALVLWDRRLKIGGMNHYLLPEGTETGPNRLRYGNVANPELLRELLALGCSAKNLQAKVFGGSSAFPRIPRSRWVPETRNWRKHFFAKRAFPLSPKTSTASGDASWCFTPKMDRLSLRILLSRRRNRRKPANRSSENGVRWILTAMQS